MTEEFIFSTRDGLKFEVPTFQEVATVQHVTDDDEYGVAKLQLNPGDVVIDVGANFGSFSIVTAHRFPEVRVIAYEPNPDNFKILERNISRNGVGVEAHHAAVWYHHRGVSLVGQGSGTGTLDQHPTGRDLVPSVTLEEILNPFDEVALLKMDCEGAEIVILNAARKETLEKVRQVIGEYHDSHIKNNPEWNGMIPTWRTALDEVFEMDWQTDPNPFFFGTRREGAPK